VPTFTVALIRKGARLMIDPQKLNDDATHVVLHAWITVYLADRSTTSAADLGAGAARLAGHSARLQESAAQLASALEKMRAANAKLALRMAEHKAFFAKYQTPE
jgi:hypothetical protein